MKATMNRINRIYDKFNKLNEYFIIGLMAAMCLVLLAQVISRYLFGKPLTWSEELARYMFVWLALLGSAWCGRGHIHVRMTALVNRFPAPVIHGLQVIISLLISLTCFYLFPHACEIFMKRSRLKAVTLGVSLGIEYIAAPVGILMIAVRGPGLGRLSGTLYETGRRIEDGCITDKFFAADGIGMPHCILPSVQRDPVLHIQ